MMWRAIVLSAVLATPVQAQEAPRLGQPVDCRLGETCWALNYPDVDPGPGAQDFQCRPRSYQGHDGTDFAIRDMAAAVKVVAAAAGEVVGARDGETDGVFVAGQKVDGKECGNGIMLRHDNGWTTQYCHLRQGSVTVRPGQKVERGAVLGLVGLSGKTEFPHVHLTLRQGKQPVDPFTSAPVGAGCGVAAKPLWADAIPYQPVALYAAGFADALPDKAALMADAGGKASLPTTGPLVLWGAMLGMAPGDKLHLRITGPDGAEIVSRDTVLDRNQAWRVEAAGRKAQPGGWPAGLYRGEIRLERAGLAPMTRSAAIELR